MNRYPVRPVSIASVCGTFDAEEMRRLVSGAATQKPDLILLPETWQGMEPEPLDSPTITFLRKVSRSNGVYILHPTAISENGRITNTALLFDRSGSLAGRYDKIYPYWDEFPAFRPGSAGQRIIDCDFGRLGIFICFDANFPDIWAEAAEQGAELIVWPSAYGAGNQLAAHALNNHFPIVTCTRPGYCTVFDIDGSRIVNVHSESPFIQWVTLDLDRCIIHENFNTEKLDTLLREDPPRIEVEKHWPEEQWIILRSAMEGISARQVCRETGIEELRDYKRRSRDSIDAMRREHP